MRPVLFTIPGLDIPIYSYGLMMVIGFLAAIQLAKVLARRKGLDPEVFVNAAIIALISGIVGARLSHVLENFSDYTDPSRGFIGNLLAALNIRSGGLTFFGGLLLAFPITAWYAWTKRVPLRLGMDIVAPCVMVGLAFGRLGCFLNGCCYGAECEAPWAITYPYGSHAYVDHAYEHELADVPPELIGMTEDGRPVLLPRETVQADPALAKVAAGERSDAVHPSQLYSTFNAFLIAGLLVAFLTLSPPPGRVFALMFILKGISRYVLEMLRVEPAVLGRGTDLFPFLPPHSYSMVISVFLVLGGIAMWFAFSRRGPSSQSTNLVPAAA